VAKTSAKDPTREAERATSFDFENFYTLIDKRNKNSMLENMQGAMPLGDGSSCHLMRPTRRVDCQSNRETYAF
jgi:hypothetical protein